jgi:hypothetical protein
MDKTITTYLIDGDPKGTQYVFINNIICQTLDAVYRKQLE